VQIVGLTEDMLITENGTFLMMLELKPIDMGASGQDFSYWVRRYQSALEKLPPGTNFQLSVQLEPRGDLPSCAGHDLLSGLLVRRLSTYHVAHDLHPLP
jgi:hypothetical protein